MKSMFLFDIDGTLLSTGGAGRRAMEAAAAGLFGGNGIGNLPLGGRTDHAIVRDILTLHQVEYASEMHAEFIGDYLKHLALILPATAGQVLPGVRRMLDRLSAMSDVGVGLLTGNVPEGAELKLRHYGLADYFSFGGYGGLHQDRCDVARDALAAARQRAGFSDATEVWVIGDTPGDIRCGRAINARVVAVATGTHGREELEAAAPDFLLDSLEDETILDGWLASRPNSR